MKVTAVAMVRDEADIIEMSVRQMLTQVDEIIVADNGSTDETAKILAGLPVVLLEDTEPGYYQSAKMSALAEIARDDGADWVVPFDADEYWTCQWGRIGDVLAAHTPDYGIVTAVLYDHVAAGDGTLHWRRPDPLPLPKVACRTAPDLMIEQGNHWARYDIPARATDAPVFTVHHFPYRTVEQFVRKVRNGAAAYRSTDLPENLGGHWRQWGHMSDDELADVFRTWYYRPDPTVRVAIGEERQPALVYDPVV